MCRGAVTRPHRHGQGNVQLLLPDAVALRKERRRLEALRHGVRRGGTARPRPHRCRRPATRRRSRPAQSMRRRGPPPAASAGQETVTPPRPATSASPSTISASATSPGSRIADASQETGSAGSSTLIHQCESCCDRRGVPAWSAVCCDDQAGAQRRSGWAAGRGPSKDGGDQTGAEEEEVGPAAGDGDE